MTTITMTAPMAITTQTQKGVTGGGTTGNDVLALVWKLPVLLWLI
jgi:hypothetical protein